MTEGGLTAALLIYLRQASDYWQIEYVRTTVDQHSVRLVAAALASLKPTEADF